MFLTVPEACERLRVSRAKLYTLLHGELRAIKIGRKTLIEVDALDAYAKNLPNFVGRGGVSKQL